MVPPTLTKVWQYMLNRQFNYFIQELPEVKHVVVTNDETSKEPVAKVNQVIMIHVVPYVLPLELTIVIVCMHLFRYWLVEVWV